MNPKSKIFFVIPSMNAGGAERVFSVILRGINKDRFEVFLLLMKREGKFLNEIPDSVRVLDLNVSRVRNAIFKIIKLAHREKPDIIFTGMIHLSILTIVLKVLFPRSTKFIARETIVLSVHNSFGQEKHPEIVNWLVRKFYRRFDAIVCQSKEMKNDLISNYGLSEQKLRLIPNPIDQEDILFKVAAGVSGLDKSRFNIVSVGRLTYQKGFDLLIESFAVVKRLKPNAFLTIVGRGEEEQRLKVLIENRELSGSVSLLGFVQNPYTILTHANLFVLSSRYEGFPNVVLEALACGTPAVAFNCPGGVDEIITEGANGFLARAGDVAMLADKIVLAMDFKFDPRLIVESVTKKFDHRVILNRYESLFSEVVC